MELVGVRVEVPANTPMVLLREQEGAQRLMPIYIGSTEASAIHVALEGIEPSRPMTHDLYIDTLQAAGIKITHVLITEVRDHTYFAEVVIEPEQGDTSAISSRPSDALAIAVRAGVPIYANEELLDEVGQASDPDDDSSAEVIIDEFKDFIDNVSPDDFATGQD